MQIFYYFIVVILNFFISFLHIFGRATLSSDWHWWIYPLLFITILQFQWYQTNSHHHNPHQMYSTLLSYCYSIAECLSQYNVNFRSLDVDSSIWSQIKSMTPFYMLRCGWPWMSIVFFYWIILPIHLQWMTEGFCWGYC